MLKEVKLNLILGTYLLDERHYMHLLKFKIALPKCVLSQ